MKNDSENMSEIYQLMTEGMFQAMYQGDKEAVQKYKDAGNRETRQIIKLVNDFIKKSQANFKDTNTFLVKSGYKFTPEFNETTNKLKALWNTMKDGNLELSKIVSTPPTKQSSPVAAKKPTKKVAPKTKPAAPATPNNPAKPVAPKPKQTPQVAQNPQSQNIKK